MKQHQHAYSYAFLKKKLQQRLTKLSIGRVYWKEDNQSITYGKPSAQLTATVTIHNPRFYIKCLLGGSIGAAESYMLGDWDCDNLTALLEIIVRNQAILNGMHSGLAYFANFVRMIKNILTINHVRRAKYNIIKHYDLSNAFFKLFLDEQMHYSSAVFTSPEDNLEAAQVHKLELICRDLQLSSNDHVLEIGSGWGALAIYMAKHFNCKVTTTTISEQQYNYVQDLIKQHQLQDNIILLKQDYRHLTGQYDKIVSIEMIESIGFHYFNRFFRICNQLLKAGGLLFLQAITIQDQEYDRYKRERDFIKRYIFPNGCLPSVHTIAKAVKNHTQMRITHMRDIGLSYAQTLAIWCKRFQQNASLIKQLNFDQRFMRMFHFYFCYCEAGFRTRYLANHQLVFEKYLYEDTVDHR